MNKSEKQANNGYKDNNGGVWFPPIGTYPKRIKTRYINEETGEVFENYLEFKLQKLNENEKIEFTGDETKRTTDGKTYWIRETKTFRLTESEGRQLKLF